MPQLRSAANELWHLRTGRRQRVSVDMRHAGIEFRSERYLRGSTASRRTSIARQDRRRLSHRRWPLDPAAHQPAASPRRNAETAWRRLRPRLGAAPSTAGRRSSWRTPPPKPVWSSPPPDRSRNGMRIRKAARWRPCRCSPSSGSATRRHNRLPAGSSARRHQSAGPDARHRGTGVRPHARGSWRRRAQHHRRASAGDGGAGHRHRSGKLTAQIDLRETGPRQSPPAAARGGHFHSGLPAGRHRAIRLQRR